MKISIIPCHKYQIDQFNSTHINYINMNMVAFVSLIGKLSQIGNFEPRIWEKKDTFCHWEQLLKTELVL